MNEANKLDDIVQIWVISQKARKNYVIRAVVGELKIVILIWNRSVW